MNAPSEPVHHLVLPEPGESLGELRGDWMTQASDLTRGEVTLVKAEWREKARLYCSPTLIMAVGVAFGLLAAMSLFAAGIGDWRAQVEDHPFLALGLAVSVGCLFSVIFKRKASPRERMMEALAESVEDIADQVRDRINPKFNQ